METAAPFKEVIAEIKQAGGEVFKLCYQCGKCDVVCPWNRVRKFSIRKVIREATFGLTEIEGEDIWRCTTCGTCPAQCPRGVKQIELGVAVRRVASNYDVFPNSVKPTRGVRASLLSDGTPLAGERAKRADWAKDLSVKEFAEGMEILYFTCCYLSYDPRLKKVAAATANVLNKAGVDFGILGTRESCCGESIRKTGAEKVFRTLAKKNIKAFIDAGVKKIIVASPHCYHTLKNEYPEFMVKFDVVHIAQYLSELMKQGRLKLTGKYGKPSQKVTYHDPCYLGRHNGIYEEPREVLRRIPGMELVEMADSHKDSLCCGGGGGRIWMETPKNERFSNLRLKQATETGAEALVTSCPYCISNFEESRLTLGCEKALEVKDLMEVIQEAL
jgi:Fe-S oxidoreductase